MFKYFNPSALVLSFIQSIYWASNKFKYSFWHDRMGGFVLCVKQHNSVINALNRTLYNIARHLKAWFPKLDPDVKWTRPNFTCWFVCQEDIFIGNFFLEMQHIWLQTLQKWQTWKQFHFSVQIIIILLHIQYFALLHPAKCIVWIIHFWFWNLIMCVFLFEKKM